MVVVESTSGTSCFPLTPWGTRFGFGPNNDLWIKGALELGQQAIQKALDHVGLAPSDISAIFFTSVTRIACPSIDARLMGFPKDIKRTPNLRSRLRCRSRGDRPRN